MSILNQEEIKVLLSGQIEEKPVMGLVDQRRQRFIMLMQRLGEENRADTVTTILNLEDTVEELKRVLEEAVKNEGDS